MLFASAEKELCSLDRCICDDNSVAIDTNSRKELLKQKSLQLPIDILLDNNYY